MKSPDRFKSRRQLLNDLEANRQRLAELESMADRADDMLGERDAELRAIVDALPDLVIRLRRDGTYLDIKSPSDEIMSRPIEELIGRNMRESGLPEPIIALHLWNMEAALRSRTVQTFEYPLKVQGGLREFEGRAVACAEDAVLFVIRDVTEAKQAREKLRVVEARLEQSRRVELIGRLAAGVAHNLNNLLIPILGYAEILLAGETPVKSQKEHLKSILKAADGASELTQQLLAAGREQEHEIRRIDLRQVVSDYEKILRTAIRKDIALEIRVHSAPVVVEADPFQIQQILLNLALNAQDAIRGRGRIVVEVRGVALREGRSGLEPGYFGSLKVSDDGEGIGEELRERIFDPFFTTKEPDKGTGLGLASVHGIVKQHGGDIRLESEVGQGTAFEILLPLCDGAVESVEEPEEIEGVADREDTVIVVEHDAGVNRLVSQILRDQGYLVLTARSGQECIQLVESRPGPIHLLLTDVVMPEMNGHELFQRLQPTLPDLRVLYMSGHTDEVIADHGVLRDGVQLVQKPFTIPRLLCQVKEALA